MNERLSSSSGRGGEPPLRLALPKGRMEQAVLDLLHEAGVDVRATSREYRPTISLPNVETKRMKPQNIVEMLALGRRDLGFAGVDWVRELNVDLVEVLDTGLDPVRIVAAAPACVLTSGDLPRRRLTVASEYRQLTMRWISERELDADFIQSFGATEVFPPEDADVIVDNTATGATLEANRLQIVDVLCQSSTRLFANPDSMRDPARKQRIDALALVLRSVLDARKRVMVEVNASNECLDAVVGHLPCMREVTVAPLYGARGFAIKAAVPRSELPTIIPAVKAAGGTDIVVSALAQIVA